MKVEFTVPSKTFLLGEYITLFNGPALILNTYPRFKLIVQEKNDQCVSPHRGITGAAANFIKKNSSFFNNYTLTFIDPFSGLGGFGASSAQFGMLFTLKNYFSNATSSIIDTIASYRAMSGNHKKYQASGVDVIAQLQGGLTYYHRERNFIKKYNWPFIDLSFCLIHTGIKIITAQHLDKLINVNIHGLTDIAFNGVAALEQNDSAAFCHAIRNYSLTMLKNGLVCKDTADLLSLIVSYPQVLAAKGCGALAADVILVLLNSTDVNQFMRWADYQRLTVINSNTYVNEGIAITDLEQNFHDQVIIVNENDIQISTAEKIVAHKKGLLHRAFSVFIFRNHLRGIELLLQQRAKNKYHCPGLWSNTCCSHPQPGENILISAQQRLNLEMSIQAPLHEVATLHYKADVGNNLIEHEIDHILIGKYQNDLIQPNSQEIAAYQWFPIEKLRQNIHDNYTIYTPWLQPALDIICSEKALHRYLGIIE
jgi:isopentenyl-diphosphate Delta-isomerase